MGVQGNPRISEEKGLFPPLSGFSRCSSGLPDKGEKGRKMAKKADFGRFPGRAARHPLKPPFVTPPFAAAQLLFANRPSKKWDGGKDSTWELADPVVGDPVRQDSDKI